MGKNDKKTPGKTASKKTVDNGKAYEFVIRKNEIKDEADFGSFKVLLTPRGAIFKNYIGLLTFVSPYAVGVDGKAQKLNTYAWLENLVGMYHICKEHGDEQYEDVTEDGKIVTYNDMLETLRIITEAHFTKITTAFIDSDHAAKEAKEHIDWLGEMQKKLADAMKEAASEEEAVKADAEEGAKVIYTEAALEAVGEDAVNMMGDAE